MEGRINNHILSGQPYLTLTPSISTPSPSFSSAVIPEISITLLLHNAPGPVTIRTRATRLDPSSCLDLIYPDGEKRTTSNVTGYFSGRNLCLVRRNRAGFLTLWPRKPHVISSSFRFEGAMSGDPNVPYEEYENAKPSKVMSVEAFMELVKTGSPEAVVAYVKETTPPGGPYGMDKCLIGHEYALRVKPDLRICEWHYGTLDALLIEADTLQSADKRLSVIPEPGWLDILTYDEHKEIRFTPVE